MAASPDKSGFPSTSEILVDLIDHKRVRHVVGIYTCLYRKSSENKVKLKIANTSANPIVIERGNVLGIFDEVLQRPVECFKPNNKTEDVPLNNIPQNLQVSNDKIKLSKDPPLTPEQIFEKIDTKHLIKEDREQWRKIIISHAEAFASDKWNIGNFRGWDVELKLKKDAKPIRSRPYSLPETQQKYLALWVEQMVHAGILERNPAAQWANPVFVVPKKQPNVFRGIFPTGA